MWNIDEFVKVLNKEVPLSNYNSTGDKRKSDKWTVRMLREYTSKHKIPTNRIGKNVYYNKESINALIDILVKRDYAEKALLTTSYSRPSEIINKAKDEMYISNTLSSSKINNNIKGAGLMSSAMAFNANNAVSEPSSSSGNKVLDILNKAKDKVFYPKEEPHMLPDKLHDLIRSQSETQIIRRDVSVITINEDLQLMVNSKKTNEEIIKELTLWLKTRGEK